MLNQFITLQAAAGADYSGIIMIVALIAIFYFMMIRPQQKQQKKIRQFRKDIKKGDTIITAGGIYAKVKDIKDNALIISIADGVNVRIDVNSVYPTAEDAATSDAALNKANEK